MIIIQSPLRVSLFGGGTDLPAYYEEHGGCVLSSTIDKYVFVTVKHRFDDQIRVGYTQTELVDRVDEVQHDLIREAMRLTGVSSGVEITTMGDIPSAGSGLGSSSTVTVGVLNALYAFQGEVVPPERLAAEAIRIEIDILGKPIGIQDQLIAAYGGLRFMEFSTEGEVKIDELKVDPDVLRHLNANLMLFYTGISRKADTILSEQQHNISDRLEVLAEMKQLAHIGRGELEAGNVDEIGHMLHYGWVLKRRLAKQITTPQIDSLYQAARESGALGGKLTGAGGGGFLLLYCPPNRKEAVRTALSGLRELPFALQRDGVKPIFNFPRSENGADQSVARPARRMGIEIKTRSKGRSKAGADLGSAAGQADSTLIEYADSMAQTIAKLPFGMIEQVVEKLHAARLQRKRVYIMGNGGSASTATHFACDLYKNVQHGDLPDFLATSLADNLAAFSAYANDDGYENVFQRSLQNTLEDGDVVIAISTSGNSENVVRAVEFAIARRAYTIGFTGFDGGKLKDLVDLEIRVPNRVIEQVEDVHLMLEHMIVTALKARHPADLSQAQPATAIVPSLDLETAATAPELAPEGEATAESTINRRGEVLYEFQRELLADEPPEILESNILRRVLAYLHAESGSLLFIDENGSVVGGKVCYQGRTDHRSPEQLDRFVKAGLAGLVVQEKKPVIIDNTDSDTRWMKRSDNEPSRSAVSVPLMQDGRVFALLSLKRNSNRRFSKDDVVVLAGIALIMSMNGLASWRQDAIVEEQQLPRAE